MSDKNYRSKKISGILDENDMTSEIFNRSRTRDEIKTERRVEAERRRKEQRAQRIEARKANIAELKNHRSDIAVLSCIVGVLILIFAAGIVWQSIQAKEAQKFEADTNKTVFSKMSNRPTLEKDRVTGVVQRVYYTKGGYLAVKMLLGNGAENLKHLDSLYVEIRNGDQEVIGKGSSSDISETYTIEAGGYNEYLFYISPEFVEIEDDPLSTISYSIFIDDDITQ